MWLLRVWICSAGRSPVRAIRARSPTHHSFRFSNNEIHRARLVRRAERIAPVALVDGDSFPGRCRHSNTSLAENCWNAVPPGSGRPLAVMPWRQRWGRSFGRTWLFRRHHASDFRKNCVQPASRTPANRRSGSQQPRSWHRSKLPPPQPAPLQLPSRTAMPLRSVGALQTESLSRLWVQSPVPNDPPSGTGAPSSPARSSVASVHGTNVWPA